MDRVKEIISSIQYATIATTDKNGQPWNSPVSALWDGMTLYWASWTENQHSKNICANNKIFIVVYDSRAPEGTGEGVYVQAIAEEINDPEEVRKILTIRTQSKPDNRKIEEMLGDYPRRFYKATPIKIWLNDASELNGNFIDIRKEVS